MPFLAASSLRCRCAALVVIAAISSSDALHASVMRSEQRKLRPGVLALSAEGELLEMSTDPFDPDAACNDIYPLGKPDTSDCAQAHHDVIVDREMCAQAATMTNAGVEPEHFVLDESWWEQHPRGCFAWPCKTAQNTDKMCYFFNPVGDDPCKKRMTNTSLVEAANATIATNTPASCKGKPVCYAPHYRNGTANANGGCPTGYQVVMNEKKCEAAASCLGFCTGAQFHIGFHNASQHLEFPEGCFIHNITGCFHFNAPSAMGKPSRPKGIPVCNATEEGHMWGEPATTAAAASTSTTKSNATNATL